MTKTSDDDYAVVTTFGWRVSHDRPYHIAELRPGGLYGTLNVGPDQKRHGALARGDDGNALSFASASEAHAYAAKNGYNTVGEGIMLPDARADHYWTVQMIEEPQQATAEEIRDYHKSSHVASILGDELWLQENSGNYQPTYAGPVSDCYWTFYAGKWHLWSLDAARENNRQTAAKRLRAGAA